METLVTDGTILPKHKPALIEFMDIAVAHIPADAAIEFAELGVTLAVASVLSPDDPS